MKTALLALLAAATAFAQAGQPTCAVVSSSAAKMQFDAASVKHADPELTRITGRISGGPGTRDSGRITAARISLANLIFQAYDLMADQLTGPDWMRDADNYGFAITATMPATTTKEEYCGMLRNLLVSRFRLAFHREQQSRPAWELILATGGPKFKKYESDSAGDPAPTAAPGVSLDERGYGVLSPSAPTGLIIGFSPKGMVHLTFRNDMKKLAAELGNYINISDGIPNGSPMPRVADQSGLTGIYDFHLEFARPDATPPDDAGTDVFAALQQQLGLKLQKVKDVTVDVLIVDHADQTPTAN
jgi:uncharacterized protein (TIGR03435 family)